jgi:RNA polymerase-binding transcription factor DksA
MPAATATFDFDQITAQPLALRWRKGDAMPLNRREIIQLVRAIEDRREALLAEIHREVARARDEQYPELAGPTPDSADEAAADLLADVDQAEVTRDLGELRELEAAAKRVTDGSYGLCIDCGVEIPVERLRAQPGAARCVECQGRHEKTYRT